MFGVGTEEDDTIDVGKMVLGNGNTDVFGIVIIFLGIVFNCFGTVTLLVNDVDNCDSSLSILTLSTDTCSIWWSQS